MSKHHLYSAALWGGIGGLLSGVILWLFSVSRYSEFWFVSGKDQLLFFIYVVGRYGGWILICTLIFALLIILAGRFFSFLRKIKHPPLFYLLFALFLQIFFWLEAENFTFFANFKSDPGCIAAHLSVLILISILFLFFYTLLKGQRRQKIDKTDSARISAGVISTIVLIHFSASFFVPAMPQMKILPKANFIQEQNYDSEGAVIVEEFEYPEARWNILLLSLDTVGGDDIGCYGNPSPVSPFLDSLAGKGVVFRNTYALSPWTLPSHGTIFTSLYPSQHGGIRKYHQFHAKDKVKARNPMLAEILKEAGYKTAAFTGGGFVAGNLGLNQGFDLYEELEEGVSFKRTNEYLDSYDGSQPFFIFLHTYVPHNYNPLPEYESMFCDSDFAGEKERVLYRRVILLNKVLGRYKKHTEEAEYIYDLYQATIRQADDLFADVVQTLVKKDFWNNTIVIILSDHGEEFLEHGGFGHGETYYEEVMRVPLILLLPPEFDFSGISVSDRVSLLDVTPTILELLNLPPLTSAEGISLIPALKGESLGNRDFFFEAADTESRIGMLSGGYKYIYNRMPPTDKRFLPDLKFNLNLIPILKYKRDELYHIETDTAEAYNINGLNPNLSEHLEAATLDNYLSRYVNYWLGGDEAGFELTKEQLEKLRALGYVH